MKILVPIDGSAHSTAALKHLIEHVGWYREKPAVDLVCVQSPLPTRLPHMALTADQLWRYYDEEGTAALASAKSMLERAGIPCATRVLVGSVAESIVEHGRKSGADLILLATRGMGAAGSPLLGSTATRILYLSTAIPVMVVNAR